MSPGSAPLGENKMQPGGARGMDHACGSKMARFWADESVGQPLVIALGVIVGDEVANGCPQ